jgi:hypothetical protein
MAATLNDPYIINFPLPTDDPVRETLNSVEFDPAYSRYPYGLYDQLLGQVLNERSQLNQYSRMLFMEGRPGHRNDVTPAERAHLVALIRAHAQRLVDLTSAMSPHVPEDEDYTLHRDRFFDRLDND